VEQHGGTRRPDARAHEVALQPVRLTGGDTRAQIGQQIGPRARCFGRGRSRPRSALRQAVQHGAGTAEAAVDKPKCGGEYEREAGDG